MNKGLILSVSLLLLYVFTLSGCGASQASIVEVPSTILDSVKIGDHKDSKRIYEEELSKLKEEEQNKFNDTLSESIQEYLLAQFELIDDNRPYMIKKFSKLLDNVNFLEMNSASLTVSINEYKEKIREFEEEDEKKKKETQKIYNEMTAEKEKEEAAEEVENKRKQSESLNFYTTGEFIEHWNLQMLSADEGNDGMIIEDAKESVVLNNIVNLKVLVLSSDWQVPIIIESDQVDDTVHTVKFKIHKMTFIHDDHTLETFKAVFVALKILKPDIDQTEVVEALNNSLLNGISLTGTIDEKHYSFDGINIRVIEEEDGVLLLSIELGD